MKHGLWIFVLVLVACSLRASTVEASMRTNARQAPGSNATMQSDSGWAGCLASAGSVFKACRDEAAGAYWLAIGRCQNLAETDDRDACREEARESLTDDRQACREQYEARRDVCDDLGDAPYDPSTDPMRFVSVIDNPFLPFRPGSTSIYEGETDEGLERIVVEVTGDTREILGIPCTVVRDRVYLEDALIEDTFDWYAQDVDGNVWYFGELSYELEDGVIVSLSGSWEAGVDGAEPGIVMPAHPAVGDVYRQEFLLGEAEDMAEVVGLDATADVPWGSFSGCRQTREWTPIDPEVEEFKTYAEGVGLVLEENRETGERVELVEVVGP